MKRLIFAMIAAATIATAAAQPKVIAHRGFWDAPGSAQNSLRALAKADSIGCWGSEFDVWMTADEKLVVNHDASFKGLPIETSQAADVTALTLSNGEHMPLLDDYLKAFAERPGIKVVCELKVHTDKRREAKAVKKVLKLMKRHKLTDRAVYITFSPEATREFVKHAPKGTEVYYLNGNWTPQQLKDEGCAGLDYSLAVMKKHPEWIEQCHSLGLKVNIWTVNRRDDLQWCIDHGADFITTNDPLLLQQMIK